MRGRVGEMNGSHFPPVHSLLGEVGADVKMSGRPLIRHRLALIAHQGVELT